MAAPFDYFVIFAEMRTGSNFLESNLNALEGVACHGEAFNPHFIAYPNQPDLLGLSFEDREAAPKKLLRRLRRKDGVLKGFRYFGDHDPRIFDEIVNDRRCAKILLTRSGVDSYVSWKIAQQTGQWKLTNVKNRKATSITFERAEFLDRQSRIDAFQDRLTTALQHSGQAAFRLDYDDLNDRDVINGLADWLGVTDRLQRLERRLKPQNPQPLEDRVCNPKEMTAALADLSRPGLSRRRSFEPRRSPAVPSYVASRTAPLLFLPIPGGPDQGVRAWLTRIAPNRNGALKDQMTRGELRDWKAGHPGFRSFTVLRHPLARAHAVYCARILPGVTEGAGQIRKRLNRQFGGAVPDHLPDPTYDLRAHRKGFEVFLHFVQASLSGQTSVRIDPAWGTQSTALTGFAEFVPPDLVLREAELAVELPALAHRVDVASPPDWQPVQCEDPFPLADIHDTGLDRLCRDVYRRDYLNFGFGAWLP